MTKKYIFLFICNNHFLCQLIPSNDLVGFPQIFWDQIIISLSLPQTVLCFSILSLLEKLLPHTFWQLLTVINSFPSQIFLIWKYFFVRIACVVNHGLNKLNLICNFDFRLEPISQYFQYFQKRYSLRKC